jgi:hypothetical protein
VTGPSEAPLADRIRALADRLYREMVPEKPIDPGAEVAPPLSSPAPLSALTPESALGLPNLDAVTVREVLGEQPDPHVLTCVRWDVAVAVRALAREIMTGSIAPGVRRVADRPLGDWLNLDDLARLLRAWV